MFEEFIINTRTDRYNPMCFIDAHEKNNPSEHYDGSSSGGYPLPSNSTTEALISLSATINFIGCWMQAIENNFLERCNMYVYCYEKTVSKILVELPKPPSPNGKH